MSIHDKALNIISHLLVIEIHYQLFNKIVFSGKHMADKLFNLKQGAASILMCPTHMKKDHRQSYISIHLFTLLC